jgi:phosphoglycerate dehydrogenase-like enzyme
VSDRKLAGLLAMRPDVVSVAFPPRVMARLLEVADLDPTLAVTDFVDPALGDTLAEAEVLVSGWGCPPIDARVLEAAPRLRAVVHAAGSVKGHMSDLVWRRGIAVSSAAAVNAYPVAQYTLAMILLSGKRAFDQARQYVLTGEHDEALARECGNEGRTVGVIGASRIGRLVLPMLAEQGFRTLVSDPTLDARQAAQLTPDAATELVELDTLLHRSDIVSIHAPMLPATRHLLNARRLGLLRDGATLINTARGALVDTVALTEHCAAGRIYAVLDVTDPEPLPLRHPLLNLPNVLVTPHIAGALGNEVARLGRFAVDEVTRLASGLPLQGLVGQEELERIA